MKLINNLAAHASNATSHPLTFLIALICVLLWGVSGRFFGFSDTWQLVINTSTTIITFLLGFLIQNRQARDTAAVQVKLNEIILAIDKADNKVLNAEDITDEKILKELHDKYEKLRKEC